MYVFNESGKGYWMDGFGCLRAEGENMPSRPAHVVVLNDQGGSIMDVSDQVAATLRAQDHGHSPVICFEPGIAKREGGNSRFVSDKSVTIRAQMGDNQPAVCYEISAGTIRSESESVTQTLRSRMGTGWCNVPIVLMESEDENNSFRPQQTP